MYLRAQPGVLGAGLVTSTVDVGFGGGEVAAGAASGAFESAGGGATGAAGAAAWASRIVCATRPSGAAEASCENNMSPIAAAVFRQICPMPCS